MRPGALDSFDAIRIWLQKNGDPKTGDISEIRWALQDVYERLMKVRLVAPTTDLTDRMWMLMERAGFKRPARRGLRLR